MLLLLVCIDRARSVYLDHMTRLEGVTHCQLKTTCNGSVADKMGDGLVSRCLGDKQPRRDMTTGDGSKRKIQRICKEEREVRMEKYIFFSLRLIFLLYYSVQ